MFASLSARLVGIGFIVIVALAFLAGLLIDASRETNTSFVAVTRSAAVIETTEAALLDLSEAESGQRGFVLTRNPAYAHSFSQRLDSAIENIERVVELTADSRVQHSRAQDIAALMKQRYTTLLEPLTLAKSGDFAGAKAMIANGGGHALMDVIGIRAKLFLDEERNLQRVRQDVAETRLAQNERLAAIGAPAMALLVIVCFALLMRSIRRPRDAMLKAMTKLGKGDLKARIDTAMGSNEFARLAQGYNDMADRLELAIAEREQSEQLLQDVNSELHHNSKVLQERGDVIELLGDMAHRMQAARSDEELAAIIQVFVPRVLPDLPGGLYAHNNSRNLLLPIATWGGLDVAPDGFAPDECWALRLGQSHYLSRPGRDIVCDHTEKGEPYHCEPLLAGGEVIGVLYLRGSVEDESRFRLTALGENIASALVNHHLQRSLREQTIRDPLTGLFNRRYMEETLQLEIARSSRSGTPLSLVMCDVDHFKRFNDEFGHEAGDIVLQAVATEMRNRFREGDVVCRFGGEEFAIIAPDSTAEDLMARVEIVREGISDMNIRQGTRVLGSTSMSFGIATWSERMARDGSELVRTADAALYQAKREGRNRALISRLAA